MVPVYCDMFETKWPYVHADPSPFQRKTLWLHSRLENPPFITGWINGTSTISIWRVFYLGNLFFPFGDFFLDSWFLALLCFSASLLFCFFAFLLPCFSASLFFCFLCFSASLLFCFSAFAMFASLLLRFLLLCISVFSSFIAVCFSASLLLWYTQFSPPNKLYIMEDYSPPARWGLLDFISVDFRRLPPSAAFRLLRTSTARIHAKCSLPDLNRENPRQVFLAGHQPRESTPSVPGRTSTARIHAKCSWPDLNRDHPRQVFPAGPQPRESTPSVPCRTSTAGENAKRYAR